MANNAYFYEMTLSAIPRKKILLVVSCLVFYLALLADALWLPYDTSIEQYSHDYPQHSRTSTRRRYYSYILQTVDKKEYLIPTPVRGYIDYQDTLVVGKALISGKPSEISWCNNGDCYRLGISIFHNDLFNYLTGGLIMVTAILTLVPSLAGRHKEFPYQYLLVFVVVGCALFYLVFSFN